MHQAAYAANGLDWAYEAIDVTPEQLDAFVRERLDDPHWAGLSVTAPHKQAIIAYGEPDEISTLLGCGNTLVLGDAPSVHNTDVPGFALALRERGLGTPARAAVVGNGATARSIVLALASLGTREVTAIVRNPTRAQGLTALAETLGIEMRIGMLDDELPRVDLLASTIPALATAPYARRWTQAAAAVFDVVYDPWPTPLGVAAEALHRQALTGLDLLAGQAVDQFFLLTQGGHTTFAACRSVAEQELRRRGAV